MDYGEDWPETPEPVKAEGKHRRKRNKRTRESRTLRQTLRYAAAVLCVGVGMVCIVVAWDIAQAHGPVPGLPTIPCNLTVN